MIYNDTEIHEFDCEVCGRHDETTDEKAFTAGWDYPPFIGAWGVLSPRTCPDCPIEKTVWWLLVAQHGEVSSLTDKQTIFIHSVMAERS